MKSGAHGRRRALSGMALAVLLCGCAREPEQPADTIYFGGSILTVNDRQPTAEALAVKDGRILAVGVRAAIERAHRGRDTRKVDLEGHTLLPGFIDSHSRFFQSLSVANQPAIHMSLAPGPDSVPLAAPSPLPALDRHQEVEWSRAGQMLYARAGITTAQEGETQADELELLQRVAEADANIIDIVAFPSIVDLDRVLASHPVQGWGEYRQRLKIGGVNLTIDGSPQKRTAYFTTPYLRGGSNGEKAGHGTLRFPEATVRQMVKRIYGLDVPLNVQASGDAAIEVILRAHELASGSHPSKNRHVTLIGGQFARREQLEKLHRYQITPSFCTLHSYFFGDAIIAARDSEQAGFSSPLRAALALTMNPTNHTDFATTPLRPMLVMWSAVNRVTRSGVVLGPDQRVSPLDALKCMTLYAAMQYGEQDDKGSLEPGKLADLVILDRNPLEGDPMAIHRIRVLETVKEGKTVYKQP